MKFEEPAPSSTKSSSASLYIRLKDGESVAFTPRGEIYKFWSVFGAKGESSPTNPEARIKYKLNAVVNVEGRLEAKILEFGAKVYEQFYTASKFGDVEKMKFQLTRTGSGKETTKYSLVPLGPVPEPALKAIANLRLNELGHKPLEPDMGPGPEDFGPPPPDAFEPELPF